MKFAFSFLFSLAFFTAPAGAAEKTQGYSQTYMILINGAVAGKETVTEQKNGAGDLVSSSEDDLMVTDGLDVKRMIFVTKMILDKDKKVPVSLQYRYSKEGGTGDGYEVQIKDGKITRTLNKGGQTSEVTASLEPDMIVFDSSVYHQFDYLVQHYDAKKGGRQLFQYFVPVIGNDIPLALTYLGSENIARKDGALALKNFKIEFVGIWGGSFAVDEDNRLVRLVVPAQNLEVVRQDLMPTTESKN